MNRNIKCEISYDGTDFHGFQIQPNHRTVQGELESALYRLTKQKISINASGRTDAGVHAKKQVCNFITDSNIPGEKWRLALKPELPDDIIMVNTTEAPLSFHSRFDVKKKTYRYYIYHHMSPDIFHRRFSWHYPYKLDLELMQVASQLFEGEHDFTNFSSARTDKENKIRRIDEAMLWKEGNEIIFQISGSGFLYNMVRIIMGTLIEVGRKKMNKEEIIPLFYTKEKILKAKTAPAHGLSLWDVQY